MALHPSSLFMFVTVVQAALTPPGSHANLWVSPSCGGIWDRSNSVGKENYNLIRGVAGTTTWSQVEQQDGEFDWSEIDSALEKAASFGGCFYAQVSVGPDSPLWVYDRGVPRVKTDDVKHKKFPQYPYYPDPTYQKYFHRLIDNFAAHLKNHKRVSSVGFVQVALGCTGDDTPYKGTPLDKQFDISKEEWEAFVNASVKYFGGAFQTGGGRIIPLLTNGGSADDYADKNLQAVGIKGSAFVRFHHLSGERSWVAEYQKYLLDVPASRKWFFTRAEMDQTWHNMPAFQLNERLGFYWGAITGLNQGLLVHDMSSSAFSELTKINYTESVDLFNKYSPQVLPENATGAFIALHAGLDASDTEMFPSDVYGPVGNKAEKKARAQKICDRHAKQYNSGCKIDDMDAIVLGQVAQRDRQMGYNDVGYDIWPTNYGRWLEQIDADDTSQGLFRIGGKLGRQSPVYSRFARGLRHHDGKTGMYFALHQNFFSATPVGPLRVRVVWYDSMAGSWQLEYTSKAGSSTTAWNQKMVGDDTWKTASFTIPDGRMGRSHERGSDFAIVSKDSTDVVMHMIEIARAKQQEPKMTVLVV